MARATTAIPLPEAIVGRETEVTRRRSRRRPILSESIIPLAAKIFLDCVAHQARLMRRFTFRLDAEPGLTVRRVANILHFARPAIAMILGRRACKANMRFALA